jgi:hypothetical protein
MRHAAWKSRADVRASDGDDVARILVRNPARLYGFA